MAAGLTETAPMRAGWPTAAVGGAGPRGRKLTNGVHKHVRRLAVLIVLMASLLIALTTPSNAATNQISGGAFYDTTHQCPGLAGFTSYAPLVLTGSLEGCLYTNVETTKLTPSGVYLESGEEVFVGSLNGGPEGSFATTYKFEAKYDPDGSEVHGRCQHPISAGSGTGGFAGVTGRLNFKDIVETEPVTYKYRGHITLT